MVSVSDDEPKPAILDREPAWGKFFPGRYNENRVIKLRGNAMKWAVQIVAGIAILFYGYDQGVMSGVNTTPEYLRLMGTDSMERTGHESSRDSAAIGGIVAVYYLGTLFGGLLGGWMGDKIGRIKTIIFACVWAIFGAALQASAQNITWMMFARLITGVGTGNLNAIVPVLTSEIFESDARGAAVGFEFFLNIGGLAIAYWVEYALYARNLPESIQWRLPLALQIVFLLGLLAVFPFMPESPRWLCQVGRTEEARRLLTQIRSTSPTPTAAEEKEIQEEFHAILDVVEASHKEIEQNGGLSYWAMLRGGAKDVQNIRRRAWLIIWLQIMQELVGIGVVTVYAPTVFEQAGYTHNKARLLSGINDLTYMFSVLVAVFTLDRVGRRITLYWGAILMGSSLIIAGVAAKYAQQYGPTGASPNPGLAYDWAAVLATFVFLYTAGFGATWLTVPWLYPTEVFPLHIRAQGGAFSVLGWSIGNGVVTEITPFLFNAIGYWTFIVFALLNFASLPFVWAWYPETAGRSLEEMDILFATKHLYVHAAEKQIALIEETNPQLYAAALKGDPDALRAIRAMDGKGASTDVPKDVLPEQTKAGTQGAAMHNEFVDDASSSIPSTPTTRRAD